MSSHKRRVIRFFAKVVLAIAIGIFVLAQFAYTKADVAYTAYDDVEDFIFYELEDEELDASTEDALREVKIYINKQALPLAEKRVDLYKFVTYIPLALFVISTFTLALVSSEEESLREQAKEEKNDR